MTEIWTEFQGRPNKVGADEVRVTLNNRGVLHLNKAAYEGLGSPSAVKLMYEENRRVIGLKPGDPQHTNSFPVKQKGEYHFRTVHMSPFCRNFGIDIRRTVLFHAIEIDREGMMRLELNKTVIIGKAGK